MKRRAAWPVNERHWRNEDYDLLREMVANDSTLEQIGRALKRTEEAVRQKIYLQLGPSSTRRAWTTHELSEARRLRGAGLSYERIAKKLGRRSSTVWGALNRG